MNMNEFMKMSKEAFPFLKEHWKREDGDLVYIRDDDYIVDYDEGVHVIWDKSIINPRLRKEFWDTCYEGDFDKEFYEIYNIFWVPSQESLQKIAMEVLKPYSRTGAQLLELFFDYVFKTFVVNKGLTKKEAEVEMRYRKGELSYLGIGEIWMCFVMEKCFNKKWENETWKDI